MAPGATREKSPLSWLLLTLGYVVALGIVGVTSKLALRSLSWQDLLLVTALVYAATAAALVLAGRAGLHWEHNTIWALVSAVCVVSALVFLYTALGHGEASKVVSVSAAYPAVTLVLSAIVLSEEITPVKALGMVLVIGGVVAISLGK